MAIAEKKELLFHVIDALPPEELNIVYRLFSSYIEEYLDTHLTDGECEEHAQALRRVGTGDYVLLTELAD